MFNNLTEEEVFLIAVEYIAKGVDLPSGIVDRLGAGTVETIKGMLDAEPIEYT